MTKEEMLIRKQIKKDWFFVFLSSLLLQLLIFKPVWGLLNSEFLVGLIRNPPSIEYVGVCLILSNFCIGLWLWIEYVKLEC